jgi:Conjugal transfer protein
MEEMSSVVERSGSQPVPSEVIHVATALDHLTVLEFGEPVTMAAAGSPAFQIERHEDKVFIKPLKAGVSTDLFVWTASRRFAYELEPPGEVKNMNFTVDSRIPTAKPAPDSSAHLEEIADMMFTRAFLGAERVDSTSIKDAKDRITVRIEHVFQSRNTLYIHYSVRNQSARAYRISVPAVAEALAPQATISVMSFHHVQLDDHMLRRLGELRERPLSPARAKVWDFDFGGFVRKSFSCPLTSLVAFSKRFFCCIASLLSSSILECFGRACHVLHAFIEFINVFLNIQDLYICQRSFP